jgi:hypothetical protein
MDEESRNAIRSIGTVIRGAVSQPEKPSRMDRVGYSTLDQRIVPATERQAAAYRARRKENGNG